MAILKRLLTLFPSYKWCGCKEGAGDDRRYQFRVKASIDNIDTSIFQVREKRVCEKCTQEKVDVLVEDTCMYDPEQDFHKRKVGVDEESMLGYGFLDQDEFARLLIEMRLLRAMEPHVSND